MKEQVLAVQRMQDYIWEHLEEDITLADLARVSLFSPWYSYRLFRDYTGLTPADYIRRLRLSQSALRLKRGECRVDGCGPGFRQCGWLPAGFSPGIRLQPWESTPVPKFPSLCLFPAASNSESLERRQSIWRPYRAYLSSYRRSPPVR